MGLNQQVVPVTRPVCENCTHWRRKREDAGDCLRQPWGVEYGSRNGKRQIVDYWTTGKYVTCKKHTLVSP